MIVVSQELAEHGFHMIAFSLEQYIYLFQLQKFELLFVNVGFCLGA
jgi:hypothetical protein